LGKISLSADTTGFAILRLLSTTLRLLALALIVGADVSQYMMLLLRRNFTYPVSLYSNENAIVYHQI